MVQLTYTDTPEIGLEGQAALGFAGRQDIQTGVNAQLGTAKVVELVFAGTWAAADVATVTLAGITVATTAAAGEDTPEEVRDALLADLEADANITRLFTLAEDGTDTIVVTGKEFGSGTGVYLDYDVTAGETTAGNGTLTATTTTEAATRGDLPFGKGVALDTTDTRGKRCTLPTATGFAFGGVVLFSHAHDNRSLTGVLGVPAQDSFNRIVQGFVYVKAEETVAPGDPAYLRHTANANGEPGNWRNDADSNTCDAIPGRFVTGGAAGSLVVLQVNAP